MSEFISYLKWNLRKIISPVYLRHYYYCTKAFLMRPFCPYSIFYPFDNGLYEVRLCSRHQSKKKADGDVLSLSIISPDGNRVFSKVNVHIRYMWGLLDQMDYDLRKRRKEALEEMLREEEG